MSRRNPIRRGALGKLRDTYAFDNGRSVAVVRAELDVGEVLVQFQGGKGRRFVRPEQLVLARPPEG